MTTLYRITIAGRDISNEIASIIEEISVVDGSDMEEDSAEIVLADIDGSTFLSQERDPVEIHLGNSDEGIGQVFQGFVSRPLCRYSRRSGRTISIQCSSVDLGGKAKEEREKHWNDKDLASILTEAFDPTGIAIKVAPRFASIMREYEAMDGEDPLAFAARLAREVGATFKMMGPQAVFGDRNSGLDILGAAMPAFEAAVGVNLIEAELTPVVAKMRYQGFANRWFDFAKGEWMEELEQLSGEASLRRTSLRPSQSIAKQTSGADKSTAERDAGEGSVTVRGSYKPQADGECRVRGVRPAVDGLYIISSVEHTASRREGYTTRLELRRPQGGAGVDER